MIKAFKALAIVGVVCFRLEFSIEKWLALMFNENFLTREEA